MQNDSPPSPIVYKPDLLPSYCISKKTENEIKHYCDPLPSKKPDLGQLSKIVVHGDMNIGI
jgi:hypothetical protein